MGVEGFRWLSQDKELGSSGMFLSFLSLSHLFTPIGFHTPKALFTILNFHTAVCDNGSGKQTLKRKP